MALLEIEDFSVRFGATEVLDSISLGIDRGQRFGLIGESDAGKTLIALAIMGMLPDAAETTGSVSFDGQKLPADEEGRAKLRGRRIGMVFQDAADGLDPLRPAGAQIAEAMQEPDEAGAAVESLLGDVGLVAADAARFPHELSRSDLQRVAIAIALAGKPELLICDDATAPLDLMAQRVVVDLIDRVCSDRGMALLYISHDIKAVAALCTRIGVLRRGKLVEMGDKLDVLGHPKHDHTRMLLAAGRHRARTLMRAPISGDIVTVRGVTKRFRRPDVSLFQPQPPQVALDDLNLSIRSGESLALIGPTGAGKSTLARIIVGLERVSSGELEFDHQLYHGDDLPRALRRDISLVFQDPDGSFNPRLTIGESVAEPLRLEQGAEFDDLGRRMVELVQAVGLSSDMLGRYPHEFSAGQRQRFAIARALMTRPKLVVLDEPVSRLDVASRGDLLVLLNRLRADYGLTFLVISHDLDMVRIVADRVAVMDKGRIIETATPAQMLGKPQEMLTRRLVAAGLPDVGIVPVL